MTRFYARSTICFWTSVLLTAGAVGLLGVSPGVSADAASNQVSFSISTLDGNEVRVSRRISSGATRSSDEARLGFQSMGISNDEDITPDVIFGGGVDNGSFTVARINGIELGLRGKLRFNESGNPENTFNSNGDGSYSFEPGQATGQSAQTPVWSFEWSVNSDFADDNGLNLDDLRYEIGLDGDPGLGTDYLVFDPISPDPPFVPFFDHAIGDNTTGNGAGQVAQSESEYLSLLAANNVAQNSWRYDFFLTGALADFDPEVDGRYSIYLAAIDADTDEELARVEIDILVGQAPFQQTIQSTAVTGDVPSASDNDFTRIDNAVQALTNGSTLILEGVFDWTEPQAMQSWADADYWSFWPADVHNVTITADALGDAVIQGPGDLPELPFEMVFGAYGPNQGWEISNLTILDFDTSIGMFHAGGGVNIFDDTRILNNRIRMATDVPSEDDEWQNIGIHFSFGDNQHIAGNHIEIPGDGLSDPGGLGSAASIAMQSNTSGGAYEGLVIEDNLIEILQAQSEEPEVVVGIWENGGAHTRNIDVVNNQFVNLHPDNDPQSNRQQGFRIHSHSSETSTVAWMGNLASGANEGFRWLPNSFGADLSSRDPVQFINNAAIGGEVGVRLESNGAGHFRDNDFSGNVIGMDNNTADQRLSDATCNWWGAADGPSAEGTGSGSAVTGVLEFEPWNVTDTGPCQGFANAVTRLSDNAVFNGFTAAINDPGTVDGDTLMGVEGVFEETLIVNKALTIRGSGPGTIIEGNMSGTDGITIPNGQTGVTIRDLRVQNFTGTCIFGALSNHNTLIDSVELDSCLATGAGGGILMNGPVDDVTITNSTVSNSTTRGIVIWNGFKTNITITGNTVTGNNCCGIELQDGTASGVTITDNTIEGNDDNGIGVVGLTGGAGANLIANNTVTDNGRYGIEVKLPNGTPGLDEDADGAIVVRDNTVSLTESVSDLRDLAGIAVFRRGWVASENNVDIPTGVIVRNNTVSGYRQDNAGSFSDGFGIVVEGLNMQVFGNSLQDNDVGIQRQSGHLPYEADTNVDGDQSNLDDDYFGRGNSPVVCASVDGNSFSDNDVDQRDVVQAGAPDPATFVINQTTGGYFCSLQAAIDQAGPGDVLQASAGVFNESVTINTGPLTLLGAQAGVSVLDRVPGSAAESVIDSVNGQRAVGIGASEVTIDGFSVTGDSLRGIVEFNSVAGTVVSNNFIYGFPDSLGISFAASSSDGQASGNSISDVFAGIYLSTGANNIEVSDNVVFDLNGGGSDQGSGIALEGNNTDVVISANQLLNNQTGLYVWTGFGEDFDGTSILNNHFEGNVSGLTNTNPTEIDATCNWWGDASGPSGEGSGLGDPVSEGVIFQPWNIEPDGNCAGDVPEIVYVDDDFAGSDPGDELTFDHPELAGPVTARFGVDAFDTVPNGLSGVGDAGLVLVAPGHYPGGNLTFDRSQRLIGAGIDITVLGSAEGDWPTGRLGNIVLESDKVEIARVQVHGYDAFRINPSQGGVENVVIRDNWLRKSNQHGITVDGQNWRITENVIEDAGQILTSNLGILGGVLDETENIFLRGNEITGSAASGVFFTNGQSIIMLNNLVEDNGGWGAVSNSSLFAAYNRVRSVPEPALELRTGDSVAVCNRAAAGSVARTTDSRVDFFFNAMEAGAVLESTDTFGPLDASLNWWQSDAVTGGDGVVTTEPELESEEEFFELCFPAPALSFGDEEILPDDGTTLLVELNKPEVLGTTGYDLALEAIELLVEIPEELEPGVLSDNCGSVTLIDNTLMFAGTMMPAGVDSCSVVLSISVQEGALGLFEVESSPFFSLETGFGGTGTQAQLSVRSPQTIDFPALSDRTIDDSPFNLSATASSGLAVDFALVSGPAVLDGDEVTLTGALGQVVIEASQPGDGQWLPAETVQQAFQVSEGAAFSIEAVSATSITVPAGQPVGQDDLPTVRVLDSGGNPVTGTSVTFAVSAGDGEINGAIQVTDDQGLAQVESWSLGEDSIHVVTASADGLTGSPVEFTAEQLAVGVGLIFDVTGDGVDLDGQTHPQGGSLVLAIEVIDTNPKPEDTLAVEVGFMSPDGSADCVDLLVEASCALLADATGLDNDFQGDLVVFDAPIMVRPDAALGDWTLVFILQVIDPDTEQVTQADSIEANLTVIADGLFQDRFEQEQIE
jgi:parallel beta-helix repeat protein